jgi:hypothetical protein
MRGVRAREPRQRDGRVGSLSGHRHLREEREGRCRDRESDSGERREHGRRVSGARTIPPVAHTGLSYRAGASRPRDGRARRGRFHAEGADNGRGARVRRWTLPLGLATTRTGLTRISRKKPDRSAWAARSLRRTIKTFGTVDGEERCAGASISSRRVVPRVLRQLSALSA